ncbi:MAG: diguanylate cyclase [Deltaproteobacteria bacterium]|nr:diguanylate cyclase [Deltaproteobacteria bacterium]
MIARKQKTAVTVISKIAERCRTSDACLVVVYGDELGRKYTLAQGQLAIGRSAQCDIQIDQEAISRQHAKVVAGFGETVISDLGSTNGTYVNDELVDSKALADGDLIKIGRTILKYLSGNNIEAAYYEEIYRLTTIDGLTQVYNRRYLNEQLEREIYRARRYSRDLSLVLFEIDNFSQVNHAFGHLAGDAVLSQLAKLIRGNSRREDLVARLERELFGVVLPEINLKNARNFAERVRKLVDSSHFDFEGAAVQITISLGCAAIGQQSDVPSMIAAASQNLALAKHRGGNCVSG